MEASYSRQFGHFGSVLEVKTHFIIPRIVSCIGLGIVLYGKI